MLNTAEAPARQFIVLFPSDKESFLSLRIKSQIIGEILSNGNALDYRTQQEENIVAVFEKFDPAYLKVFTAFNVATVNFDMGYVEIFRETDNIYTLASLIQKSRKNLLNSIITSQSDGWRNQVTRHFEENNRICENVRIRICRFFLNTIERLENERNQKLVSLKDQTAEKVKEEFFDRIKETAHTDSSFLYEWQNA